MLPLWEAISAGIEGVSCAIIVSAGREFQMESELFVRGCVSGKNMGGHELRGWQRSDHPGPSELWRGQVLDFKCG
jgi:hypothetical protein